jgi:cysteinylglycine-S-conjugate dipeptidase
MRRAQGLTPKDVAKLMPQLKDDLARLVAIPSVSAPGFPEETRPALLEAHEAVGGLFSEAGVERFSTLDLPDTAPVITGEIPAPAGAPTVLLYGHYDVVGAGDESKWESPPFEAAERDGAIYGRGTADSKSNVLMHVGALRAYGGKPPVGIKLLIEGQEEVGSPLEDPAKLGKFAADALIIADGGNIEPGTPSLTTAIRGDAAITGADARRCGYVQQTSSATAQRLPLHIGDSKQHLYGDCDVEGPKDHHGRVIAT